MISFLYVFMVSVLPFESRNISSERSPSVSVSDGAVQAVKKIRKAGFRNFSLDLIYGLPGQKLEDWRATLENVLKR